jgi:NAD kinase
MNEVTIHRGPSSHLIYMNVGVDGQHLTEAVVSLIRPHRSTELI